ncbi:hypothetical protein [Planomonospora algeriensis]
MITLKVATGGRRARRELILVIAQVFAPDGVLIAALVQLCDGAITAAHLDRDTRAAAPVHSTAALIARGRPRRRARWPAPRRQLGRRGRLTSHRTSVLMSL